MVSAVNFGFVSSAARDEVEALEDLPNGSGSGGAASSGANRCPHHGAPAIAR